MNGVNSILAATDLSGPARHAVRRACLLASGNNIELTVLHVISQTGLDLLRQVLGRKTEPVEQHLLDAARVDLDQSVLEIADSYNLHPKTEVASGLVIQEILDRADAIDAQLIVVGVRGEGFMRHLLLGSTTERLLRKSRRPLLVVRQMPHEAYRRVLVPIDFSQWSPQALDTALNIAPGAEIVLLHALELPFEGKLQYAGVDDPTIEHYRTEAYNEAFARMKTMVDRTDLDPRHVELCIRHGNASGVILEQEQERGCDLIVVGKHGKGMFEELLLGSVTKRVAAEAVSDVLVVAGPA